MKITEDSGAAFTAILNRERNYAKLAKYIADVKGDVSHSDITEDLPFYRGTSAAKREMMELAIAYGYSHNIIIRKNMTGTIELFRGERLRETNLDKMILAQSPDLACNYRNELAPFSKLHQLTQLDGHNWTNHHCSPGGECGCIGHRKEEMMIPGFNMIVLDIDGTVQLDITKKLLADFTYLIYTTKRHTEEEHRYRIVLPISHELKLDSKTFKDYMTGVYDWLPFQLDDQTDQRSRKWASCDGEYWYNEGRLVDGLMFIPNTKRNDEYKTKIASLESLGNLERWFVLNSSEGSRNNMLLKYAMLLVDAGLNEESIRSHVTDLNGKISDPLEAIEIERTIMVTVAKALAKV